MNGMLGKFARPAGTGPPEIFLMNSSSPRLVAWLVVSAGLAFAEPPAAVVLTGDAAAPIASGVGVPAGRAYFWTSGTGATVIKKDGATTYDRYGDTYVQSAATLKNLAAVLAKQGLTMQDVIYLRVYVAPDAAKGGKPDFPAWFRAYGEVFNTKENPVKTARSTVGVAALTNPDWLIEIEAVAVYPEKK
jgi:enamine deaminase RidA (YjgF/YER057c/UK114 family)